MGARPRAWLRRRRAGAVNRQKAGGNFPGGLTLLAIATAAAVGHLHAAETLFWGSDGVGAGDWTESGLDWWNGGEAVNWSQGSHAVFQEPGGTVKAYERGPTMQMPIISSTLMDSAISWGELKKTGAGTDGGGSMPRLRWDRRISTGPRCSRFPEGAVPSGITYPGRAQLISANQDPPIARPSQSPRRRTPEPLRRRTSCCD